MQFTLRSNGELKHETKQSEQSEQSITNVVTCGYVHNFICSGSIFLGKLKFNPIVLYLALPMALERLLGWI